MTKVKFKVNTGWNGKRYRPNDIEIVSDFLAEQWQEYGIADIVEKIKQPKKPTKKATKKEEG